MPLPDGVLARPLADADVDAVVELVNACELADAGRVMMERADLLSDMGTDGFDRERDAVVVSEGDRLVAWGLIVHRRGRWADVHPNARGRGIGTWLIRWSEARARELGTDRIGQTIEDARTDVAAMFEARGYTPRRTGWILRMAHPSQPKPPSPPEGVALRGVQTGEEDETLAMFEAAFMDFEDRLPSSLTTWRSMTFQREGFVPEDLVVAVHESVIVGGGIPDRLGRDLGRQARRSARPAPARYRAVATTDGVRPVVRTRLHAHQPVHGLQHWGAHPLRTGGHARGRIVHAPRDRSVAAVAAGFEPARRLPAYTLSRRAPSSARAGHRPESTERPPRADQTRRRAQCGGPEKSKSGPRWARPQVRGGGVIRTREGRIRPLTAFEAVPFVHSGTPPRGV